jgi:hypothetical protein
MKSLSTPDPSSRVLPAFRRHYAFHNQRSFEVCALRACFCAPVRPRISLLNIYVDLGSNLIIVGSFKSPNLALSFYIVLGMLDGWLLCYSIEASSQDFILYSPPSANEQRA